MKFEKKNLSKEVYRENTESGRHLDKIGVNKKMEKHQKMQRSSTLIRLCLIVQIQMILILKLKLIYLTTTD